MDIGYVYVYSCWFSAYFIQYVVAVLDGKNISEGKAFNKKDASQIAAQVAVDKLGIVNSDSIGEENGVHK